VVTDLFLGGLQAVQAPAKEPASAP
jgi:hypothetical protein